MMKNALYIYGVGGSFDFKIDMYYLCKVTTFDLCYHLYKHLGWYQKSTKILLSFFQNSNSFKFLIDQKKYSCVCAHRAHTSNLVIRVGTIFDFFQPLLEKQTLYIHT